MKGQIERLILEAKALPDTDGLTSHDMWAPKNNRAGLITFFEELLKYLPDPELDRRILTPAKNIITQKMVTVSNADGSFNESLTPKAVYDALNSAGHPVRDYLILKAHGLPLT